MTLVESLHTAARRYCVDRAIKLREEYSVADSGEQKRLFQRFRMLDRMLTEIEGFVPTDFSSLKEAQSLLTLVGQTDKALAIHPWERVPKHISRLEQEQFVAHLHTLTAAPNWMNAVSPLPYRRVLGADESKRIWRELKKHWQVIGGYWYPEPLLNTAPPQAVIFCADSFDDKVRPERLQQILLQRGIERVFELFEFADESEYEIDTALLEVCYGASGEQYCTSAALDWVICASHESEITVAGEWLIAALQAEWVD